MINEISKIPGWCRFMYDFSGVFAEKCKIDDQIGYKFKFKNVNVFLATQNEIFLNVWEITIGPHNNKMTIYSCINGGSKYILHKFYIEPNGYKQREIKVISVEDLYNSFRNNFAWILE